MKKLSLSLLALTLILGLTACGGKQDQEPQVSSLHSPVAQEKKDTKQSKEQKDDLYYGDLIPPAYQARHEGKEVDASIFKNKVALITIGATWCPDCRNEFEILNQLYQKYKNDPEVVFLTTIAVDGTKETEEEALKYFKDHNLDLPIYTATNNEIRKIFRVKRIPTLLVVGKNGNCVELGQNPDGSPRYYLIEGGEAAQLEQAIENGKRLR